MPGGFVCSGSFKDELDAGAVKAVVSGQRALRELFSEHQRSFWAEHAPDDIDLDRLAILGR